jgi:hypothetical protein
MAPRPSDAPAPEVRPDPATDDPGSVAQGGRGGPLDELLDDGQEEVFSRYEVEHGLIEHHVEAGGVSPEQGSHPPPKP